MADITEYLADFELTTLVRGVDVTCGAKGLEPLWFQGSDEKGLAVFVSALDAELYRQFAISSGSSGWTRVPLAKFGLFEHVKTAGGRLACQLTFGCWR